MRATLAVCLVVALLPAGVLAAAPSATFWNPFRQPSDNLVDLAFDLLRNLLAGFTTFASRTVSLFRVADPSYLGYQSPSAYAPAFLGLKTEQGIPVRPPSPIPDTSGTGTPCGGSDADPFWAGDCSCHCSTGGVPSLTYEATDRCPENDNRTCEDCRAITRHDKHVTTVAGCREEDFGL